MKKRILRGLLSILVIAALTAFSGCDVGNPFQSVLPETSSSVEESSSESSEGSSGDSSSAGVGDNSGDSSSQTPSAHTHEGTMVAANAATCTEAGNHAYYTCDCGKAFEDVGCTIETTVAEMTISATDHAFDNACDTTCNNEDCTHVRTVPAHADTDDDLKCDACGKNMSNGGPVELPEDEF